MAYMMPTDPQEVESGMQYSDLKLDTPYHIKMPEDTVTPEGRVELCEYLKRCGAPALPRWWDWSWVVTKDPDRKIVGTLPKRYARWARQELGYKVQSEILQEVGNIARRNTNSNNEYLFELVTQCDWKDGDFGDKGSCFWGEYREAPKILYSMNYPRALAIRFYRVQDSMREIDRYVRQNLVWRCDKHGEQHYIDWRTKRGQWLACPYCDHRYNVLEDNIQYTSRRGKDKYAYAWYKVAVDPKGSGFARSWLMHDKEDPNKVVMFNGYPSSFQLFDQARVLATALGYTYRKVGIKSDGGGMYLNGDAIRVAPADTDATLLAVRAVVNTYDHRQQCDDEDTVYCETCDTRMYYGDHFSFEGVYMCVDCYNENTGHCDNCEDTYWSDDMTWVEQYGEHVCSYCLANDYDQCGECNDYLHTSDLNDEGHCSQCAEEIAKEMENEEGN